MSRFTKALRAALDKGGVTVSVFAHRLGHANSGLAYNVLNDKRALPLDDLERWLTAAGLKPGTPEYHRLRRYAYEDYAPRWALLLINQQTESRAFMQLVCDKLRALGVEPPPIPAAFLPDAEEEGAPAEPPPARARRPSRLARQ